MSASIPLPSEISNHILQLAAVKEKDKDDFTIGDLSLGSPSNAISWTWNTPHPKPSSGNPSIHRLLRKLLESPHLCASIEHLSFSGDPGTIERINEREIKAVEDLVNGAQFPLAPLWIDALNLGNINVFVALVLSQLPNLQTLHLDQDFFASSQFLGLLFQHALSPIQSSSRPVSIFSCLHNISLFTPEPVAGIRRSSTRASIDTDQVLSLFYLPTIQSIEAVVLPRKRMSLPKSNPPCASNLQSLKLPRCELDLDGLKMFLSVAPNLETLCYDRRCDLDPREPDKGPSRVYDLSKLGRALIHIRETLKHLSLPISYYTSTAMEPDWPNETCCVVSSPFSFQQFQKLEYLEIPFVVLFGYHQTSMTSYNPHKLLPCSLRHLFLRDDLANCVDHEWEAPACLARLKELILDCVGPDKTLPALKSMTLRVMNGLHEDWDESHQDELRSMCTSAGLSCSISKKIYPF
ncbi:hypothetical protein MMC31_005797 [Peltigera leucophlebia]|nr:hypothetical protein [Peltigera leucophlebia]